MSSKLSLLLFGLVVMAAIASAMDNEEEDIQEVAEELAVEREVREAEPAERQRKRGRGAKRRRNRKNKKGNKKNKGKGRPKGQRRGPRRQTKSGGRASTSLDDSCFETSIQYMKVWKDVVGNFEKQFKRIVKQNSTGNSKSGKKGAFASIANKLVDIGGGNKSNMSCSGNYTSSGAMQIANLTKTLFECEMNINASCNPSNLPQPNMTFLNECDNLTKTFKEAAETCLGKTIGSNKTSSSDACTCWTSDSLNTTFSEMKKCKASDDAKAMAAALKNCTSAFSTCRKYEDDAGSAISTCSTTSSALLAKAGALSANSNAMGDAKTKMSSLASSRRTSRKTRATATTCAEVISKSKTLITYASDSPTSTKIATLAKEISGAGSLTCTTQEKSDMSTQVTSITSAISTIDTALASVQSQLSTMTGTTASTSALSSAAAAASTSTASSSGRRARLVREIMKKRNL